MEVTPEKQNLDEVFSNKKYNIDFYQRDYKWNNEPVERLLDDIFYKFNLEYKPELDPSGGTIQNHYGWYYLNTYVTNNIDDDVYVVDGQQRLTTMTLILIKLHKMARKNDLKEANWLDSKIAGWTGSEQTFWMNHEKHNCVFSDLYEGTKEINDISTETGITAENMISNYLLIEKWMEENLDTSHKLQTFIYYFLRRIVMVNLSVQQTEVPMIFEVINDRGVKLKPYEILKGKLLGQIDKDELKEFRFNELWEEKVKEVNDIKEDEIDTFFTYYLKAKYSDERKKANRFDKDYHREIFMPDIDAKMKLKHKPKRVKEFLRNEFSYYPSLYSKVLTASKNDESEFEFTFYNDLNDMDGQFLLILSACDLCDKEEKEKIQLVSREVDRYFSLLQLQNAYDSNSLQDSFYRISKEIRSGEAEQIREVFDRHLLEELSKQRNTEVSVPFSYGYFKQIGMNLNSRFKKYFFARIESFLAENLEEGMRQSIKDLVTKRGPVHGFHIEHILANNGENLKLFGNDEDLFEQERNRLGGLLILKGKDNQSSRNESYKKKLETYSGTLLWNETLRKDFYKSNIDFKIMRMKYNLEFESYDKFGPEELEKRQRLLYDIAKIIWE